MRDRTVDGSEASLCLTCTNAVVTRGTRSEEYIACNFGGGLRTVNFTVCECTGYSTRGEARKLVTIEGFTPQKREVYAEIRIR
jgi:hypothetical protein